MTAKIINGDYVKNGRTLQETEYIDALLQTVSLALKTERESFYPDKNFGSHIFALSDSNAEFALSRARQAVHNLNGVYIKSARAQTDGFEFTVLINNKERQVLIKNEHYI